MSSRSFAFSTMVTTAAVVSVCACAWGQASQPSTTVPKVAGEASTKPPGKLKLLVWGTAKSEEEAQALLADYKKTKSEWEAYLEFPSGYPRVLGSLDIPGSEPNVRLLVAGVCHEEEAGILNDAFRAINETCYTIDAQKDSIEVACPAPHRQRYMPRTMMIKQEGKRLVGVLFRAMISDDYSIVLVLRNKDGSLLERKDESGLCDDADLWWGKNRKTLQFTGVCVTGLGTTLGTARVKKIFSIENDKIAVAEESEVLTTPTIHD